MDELVAKLRQEVAAERERRDFYLLTLFKWQREPLLQTLPFSMQLQIEWRMRFGSIATGRLSDLDEIETTWRHLRADGLIEGEWGGQPVLTPAGREVVERILFPLSSTGTADEQPGASILSTDTAVTLTTSGDVPSETVERTPPVKPSDDAKGAAVPSIGRVAYEGKIGGTATYWFNETDGSIMERHGRMNEGYERLIHNAISHIVGREAIEQTPGAAGNRPGEKLLHREHIGQQLACFAWGRWRGNFETLDASLKTFAKFNEVFTFGPQSFRFVLLDNPLIRDLVSQGWMIGRYRHNWEAVKTVEVEPGILSLDVMQEGGWPYAEVIARQAADFLKVEIWHNGRFVNALFGYLLNLWTALLEDGLEPIQTPKNSDVAISAIWFAGSPPFAEGELGESLAQVRATLPLQATEDIGKVTLSDPAPIASSIQDNKLEPKLKPWEQIPEHKWDRLAVRMLWEGYQDPEIRDKIDRGMASKTVTNRLSVLRQLYPELVPTREQLRRKRTIRPLQS